jgi:hypothetical protein
LAWMGPWMEIDLCIMIRSIGRGGVIDYMCLQMASPSCGGAGRRRTESGDMRHQLSESQRIRLLPVFQLPRQRSRRRNACTSHTECGRRSGVGEGGTQYDYALPAKHRIEAINDNIPRLGWPDRWNLLPEMHSAACLLLS